MEILPGVHRIETPMGKRKLFQHFVLGDNVMLIDVGLPETPEQYIAPYLDQQGVHRRDAKVYALITHPDTDHFGGCASFKNLYRQGQVWVHQEDAPLVRDREKCMAERYDFAVPWGWPLPADARERAWKNLGQPAKIDLLLWTGGRYTVTQNPLRQFQMIHVPGHSLGHMALWLPEEKAAIITDAALWKGVPGVDGKMSIPPTYRFLPQYLQTIEYLESLNLELMMTSHFDLLKGSDVVKDFLAESRVFVERLEAELESLFRRHDAFLSLEEICREISPRLGEWPESAVYYVAWPVTASLNRWLDIGKLDWKTKKGVQRVQLKSG
jgi:glyoxylase-like metal-dependent hydrolase (beta-lactamase superfamily II)